MDAARSLNSVQAVKTETVQTRQLLWISECRHTDRTGYFIMKIVQQGLYIHGKGWKQVKVTFRKLNGLVVDDQGIGFANEQWSLVLWPRLNSVLLTNQIVFLDMFWWFDGIIINILYFRELSVSARGAWSRKLGESRKEEFVRKSWLGRLKHGLLKLFEYLCTLIRVTNE